MAIQSGMKIFVCTMSQASFVCDLASWRCTLYVVLIATVWCLTVTPFMTGHCQSYRKMWLSVTAVRFTPLSPRQREKEIEQDSPRSHFPPLTFVGDSGRLLLTHSQYAMAGVKFVPESWIYARSSTSNFFCELELGYHNVSSDGFVP